MKDKLVIKFDSIKIFKALLRVPYDPKMIGLALWVIYRYNFPTITSAYRKEKVHDKDSGIHLTIPCRALDWSIEKMQDPKLCEDDINNHWEYDPERPEKRCAIVHDVGLGPHLHTQVHPRTVFHPKGRGEKP